MLVAGAFELSPDGARRLIRLLPVPDYAAPSLHDLIATAAVPGSIVIKGGWQGYPGLSERGHDPAVLCAMRAQLVLTRTLGVLEPEASGVGYVPWPLSHPLAQILRYVRVPLGTGISSTSLPDLTDTSGFQARRYPPPLPDLTRFRGTTPRAQVFSQGRTGLTPLYHLWMFNIPVRNRSSIAVSENGNCPFADWATC